MSFVTEKTSPSHTVRAMLTVGAISAVLIGAPLIAGCGSQGSDGPEGRDPAAAATMKPSTAPSSATDAPSQADGSDEADGSAADDAAGSGSAAAADDEPAFSPSDGLDEDGRWAGVTALDYVTLPEYTGISVPAQEVSVSAQEVQAQIDQIMANYSTTEQVTDRAIADGDTVNIDYVGSIDGVEFEGGSTGGAGTMVTIGVTQYIDDFLEQLIGHEPGENFDIEVTFPDDYHAEDLAGKDAVFNITVNYISETVIPEPTDEFVAASLSDSYGWLTAADMSKDIEEGLASQRLDQYVQNYVFDHSEVAEIPQGMVEYQEQSLIDYYRSYAAMSGLDLDDALPMLAGVESVEELIEGQRDQVDDAARSSLVIQAIAEDAGIAVDNDGVATYFSQAMGIDDISSYAQRYGMPYLKLVTLDDAVIDYLAANAVVEGQGQAADDADEEQAASQDGAEGDVEQADEGQPAGSEEAAGE